ncbi:MAG: trehalase family glycosidase [Phycisphaerae bacterium]|nr:trehalase family glycosidase [Phycisphaerae bacterium]
MPILSLDKLRHRLEAFNANESEDVVNAIPDAQAFDWIAANAPLFECPDQTIEQVYCFRWWTFRKHIRHTPAGMVVTEFILPVKHAGAFNTISCALGFHIAEGRWLRDQKFLDQYIRFWFRGNDGRPQPHFHKYSSWVAAAVLDRVRVTGDLTFAADLLEDLIADYRAWESERRLSNGLFWQFDVWDGMEESITGSRVHRNARPTISSYMFANAMAIAEIAAAVGRREIEQEFRAKADEIRQAVNRLLWDDSARFFKAQFQEDGLSDAREAIGFVPWCFNIPEPGREDAWLALIDPQGFWAPAGITTAERRHPRFRSHGVGKCEWDGACWPFATSQTLWAMANLLRHYSQRYVSRTHFLQAMQTYARAHQKDGKPYIGEYYDEITGEWLKGDNPRSRHYNHSTFCDLVIAGLAGLVPRLEPEVVVDPLVPEEAWDFFCLENLCYHGRSLTILWDRDGSHYHRGAGLQVLADGVRIAHSNCLGRITGRLP